MMRHSIYYFISLMFLFFISPIQASNLKEIEQDLSDSLITTKITARFTESKNINPLTNEKVYVPRSFREKKDQKNILFEDENEEF